MEKAYISLVLHAHLPFVQHPEHKDFLEENWLFEAISETYLPLLRMFERLSRDAIPLRLTLSLSPTLTEMVSDELLQNRYIRYLEKHIELGEKEIVRTRGDEDFSYLAHMYLDFYRTNLRDFKEKYRKNEEA